MPLSILYIKDEIKKGEIKPIYFLFGEDSYNINLTLKIISERVDSFITSEFDKEIFHGKEVTLQNVLSNASTFPFGSQKKLIVLKEFEEIKDKNELKNYADSPSDFTVLIIINNGNLPKKLAEPFKTLDKLNYLYEAKALKGKYLLSWLSLFAASNNKTLTNENAQLLADLVGENREMLEAQLEKIFTYLGERTEITFDDIKKLAISLKEFSIFDLQDAVAKKDSSETLKIAFNMLDNGKELTEILNYFTRYFLTVSRVFELDRDKISQGEGAKILGIHPFYYSKCRELRRSYTDKDLLSVSRALLKADIAIKTTNADKKTLTTILFAEMFQS
ncbi:MAG: DNA polymerase III subunit delta [Bacteroidetes bacterium]|nr:DNA polymerase III subunit delta [Bacteroidota bacterium]